VHHDRPHADEPEERDVLGETLQQPRFLKWRAAELDDHGPAEVLPHERQGLEEGARLGQRALRDRRSRHVRYSALIRTYS
jgi:hypothetical protein